MMEGKGPSVSLMAKTIHQKMDLSTAVRQLDGKCPTMWRLSFTWLPRRNKEHNW